MFEFQRFGHILYLMLCFHLLGKDSILCLLCLHFSGSISFYGLWHLELDLLWFMGWTCHLGWLFYTPKLCPKLKTLHTLVFIALHGVWQSGGWFLPAVEAMEV